MGEIRLERRRFLTAVVALAGTTQALRLSKAWAQDQSSGELATAMAQMARRLYPHDGLADSVYANILNDALSSTAGDPAFANMLAEAQQALDARQSAAFVDLDEQGQIAALRSIEQTAVFGAIQTAVRLRLYNHPSFWALIGYDGPSWQFGGYVNRGIGEIDWLPEDE